MSKKITIITGFLNTLNLTAGYDLLASPEGLDDWLGKMVVTANSPVLSLQDMALAIEFREALRDLASGNSGLTPSLAAAEVVNRAAGMVELSFSFSQDGSAQLASSASGLDGAIAGILVAVHAAMLDGSWARLKICKNPDCRWAFYDRSRNHSRVWCEMAGCGNRMKARRFRQRASAARTTVDPGSGQK